MDENSNRCATLRRRLRLLLTCATLLAVAPGCVFVSGNLNPFSQRTEPLEERVVSGEGDAKIALIDISNVISTDEQQGAFGFGRKESVVARVEAELRRAAEDEKVKGVILRINSPGGAVTASDILYERIRRFRAETGKPVIAQLLDTAASGAYYVALAADEIVAHRTTVTGSVGVVLYSINVAGLLDKIGVRDQTIKSGAKKDIGSPLRRMTAEERELLESVLFEMQSRFMSLVRERRPKVTDEAQVVIGDGRIFTAGQALSIGLIDSIGYLEETIERLRRRVGVEQARVVMYRRAEEHSENLYSRAAVSGGMTVNLVNVDFAPLLRTPQFLYLWMPQSE